VILRIADEMVRITAATVRDTQEAVICTLAPLRNGNGKARDAAATARSTNGMLRN